MNISNVSSASAQWQSITQTPPNQRAQDFQSLRSALQTGDLTAAQQAFSSLQKDIQNTSQVAGTANNPPEQPTSPSQIGKDFQALQTALQSGDLSTARSAFETLKQDLQSANSAQRAHHHHHGHKSGNTPSTSSQNPSAAANATANSSSIVNPLLDIQA